MMGESGQFINRIVLRLYSSRGSKSDIGRGEVHIEQEPLYFDILQPKRGEGGTHFHNKLSLSGTDLQHSNNNPFIIIP